MLSTKSSILSLSITLMLSMKLASFITTTQERLLISLQEPSNMEKGWYSTKLTKDSTKDGDGFQLAKDTFCKVFWPDNAWTLLKKRKTLDPKLFNGIRLEDLTNNGGQYLSKLESGKSNLVMHLANFYPLKTIRLMTEVSSKLTTIMVLHKLGESQAMFQNDLFAKSQHH